VVRLAYTRSVPDSVLTAILQMDLSEPVLERLHSGFYWN